MMRENQDSLATFLFNSTSIQLSSVQSLSRVQLFATPWIAARQASLPITNSVHSDSHPSSQWCHSATSSSVVPFFSCPQSLPASECFLMSQLFVWGGQRTGASALASFLPKKSQGWSPSEWTGWIISLGAHKMFAERTVNQCSLSFSTIRFLTWLWGNYCSLLSLFPFMGISSQDNSYSYQQIAMYI